MFKSLHKLCTAPMKSSYLVDGRIAINVCERQCSHGLKCIPKYFEVLYILVLTYFTYSVFVFKYILKVPKA